MANFEILVLLTDKSPEVDGAKAGEVIEIRPEGWPWSDLELSHPHAQIIVAPILPTHAMTLYYPHSWGQRQKRLKYPQKQHRIDLTKLPQQEHFVGGERKQAKVVLTNDDIINATYKVP